MKEKDTNIIINGFTKHYGYLLEEIKSKQSNSELWTVCKHINGEQNRLIFLTPNKLSELIQYDIPYDDNNIYIVLSQDEINKDKETEELQINGLLEKPLIRVNIKGRKVSYSESVKFEVVEELVTIMNNSNLQGDKHNTKNLKKPWLTIGIIVLNILLYLVTAYLTFTYFQGNVFESDIRALILMGAKVNPLIQQGQYFRLVTCMFLHGGIVHLAVNMYSLYAIGPLVESAYGRGKYILLYFVAGITSSIFSYIFSTAVSIGASGAIFGLLGAVLVLAIKAREKTGKAYIRNILSVIFVNIIIGATLPNIDNFAHIGGLVGGVVIAFLVTLKIEN